MEKEQLNKKFRFIRLVIWLGPLVLMIWILNENFVPSGRLEIKYNIVNGSRLIRNFAAKEKDRIIGTENGKKDYYQLITKEPVYFDLKTPRSFPKATITLKYQNPLGQPEINLGVAQKGGGYYLKNLAVYNHQLESLPEYWEEIREGDLILKQKNKLVKTSLDRLKQIDEELGLKGGEKSTDTGKITSLEKEKDEIMALLTEKRPKVKYSSIGQFLENLPDYQKILVYNFDLSQYFRLKDYQPSDKITEINEGLRGSHEIYTYIKDEPLDFTFYWQDINRHYGKDDFKIEVFRGQSDGEKIKTLEIKDDREIAATGKASALKEINLKIPNLKEGLYRIKLEIKNDEIFIRKIESKQHKIVFANHLYLADNNEYLDALPDLKEKPAVIYSNGNNFTFRTAHQKGFQSVRVENESLNLEEVNKEYFTKRTEWPAELKEIYSPKNDLYISASGLFAFSKDQFFNPTVVTINEQTDLNNFDYVISYYPMKAREDNWLLATQTVEAPYLYTENGITKFIINLPGLPENRRLLEIKEVDVLLERESFNFKNFFPRLKNYFTKSLKKI